MGEFASKGVAGAGLGTGIAGLALGVMNSGAGLLGLGRNNGFGWGNGWNGWGGNACGNCGGWNGYGWNGAGAAFDMGVSEALAERDARIAQLEANKYSDSSDLVLYKYFDEKVRAIEARLNEQAVFNATASSGMGTITAQIAALQQAIGGITQTVVPKSVICDTRQCGNTTVV